MRQNKNLPSIRVRPVRRPQRLVVLAVAPVEELDIIGPWEVFATANNIVRDPRPAYQIELVTTTQKGSFLGDSGLTLSAMRHYRAALGMVDTLIIPGGSGPIKTRDADVLEWVRSVAKKARRVVSVCTGAFLLAKAGLLNEKTATTHWMFADELRRHFPRVSVEPDQIYVRDGNVYTSAGVTAGMDLALALLEEDFGSRIALEVARRLVLFLRRPGGQAQFSVLLASQASENKPLRELQVWIAENLQRDLSVEYLASRVAMSPRNFARTFVRETGVTPAHLVEQLRVEAARRELELTEHGLESIAARTGFGSAEVMRRAFQRRLGISPHLYRERFSTSFSPNR